MAETAMAGAGCSAPTSNNTAETLIPMITGQRQPQRRPMRRHSLSHSQPPRAAPAAPAIHWAEATKPASVALNFGASDIDGTIFEEKIAHYALADSPVGLTQQRILKLIREAGKIPVRRNALYDVLEVHDQDHARSHPVS